MFYFFASVKNWYNWFLSEGDYLMIAEKISLNRRFFFDVSCKGDYYLNLSVWLFICCRKKFNFGIQGFKSNFLLALKHFNKTVLSQCVHSMSLTAISN